MLVGVTLIFASGARARVKFFIFYFFAMVMHHTIEKKIKSDLGEFGCARGPQRASKGKFRQFGCVRTNSGARARGLSFIFYFVLNGMLQKSIPCRKIKKVAAGKPGARAHPNQHVTACSP